MIGERYDFEAEGWREILKHNGLGGFEDLWNLRHEWVQPPNTRRGGFGGVARHEFTLPDGGRRRYYVKIHKNRLRRTALRPWLGTPVLLEELRNHHRCDRAGVHTARPVYCANRRVAGEQRGIFVTEEITSHEPLTDVIARWEQGEAPAAQRARVVEAVARQLKKLHDARIRVAAYTPDHIWVRVEQSAGEDWNVSALLLDLERLRTSVFPRLTQVADLVVLQLATPGIRRSERLRFLLGYLGSERLTPAARDLWRRVARAAETKRQRREQGRHRGIRDLRARLGLRRTS